MDGGCKDEKSTVSALAESTSEKPLEIHREVKVELAEAAEKLQIEDGCAVNEHLKDISDPAKDEKETSADDINLEEDARSLTVEVNSSEINSSVDGDSEDKWTNLGDKYEEPVFDGTENVDTEEFRRSSSGSVGSDFSLQGSFTERALAIRNFVKVKGADAVSTILRRLSGEKDENGTTDAAQNAASENHSADEESEEADTETEVRSVWNPLNFIKSGLDFDSLIKGSLVESEPIKDSTGKSVMKGRILVYTKLTCHECRMARALLHQKELQFVEINVDIFPSRLVELERNTGSSTVPKVYFNDLLIGGFNELKRLEDAGVLDENVKDLYNEEPPSGAPLPPLPGEDDESGCGKIDEFAAIVRKMRESIVVKDRFYKMRKFSKCFLGSEAVDFLSEDQYLEREEAVEFGCKLASMHFFRHVLDENIFEDGNHLYRFLDHDPIITTQCYNFPKGTIDVKPKALVEISARIRVLSSAILEAYVSEDGRHVNYRSIYGCEEFKRFVRITEELQRIDIDDVSREEKLSFFINLYNMMAIHAILMWGPPTNALDRRRFFGDFKYVIGGCPYSLSAIQNGILRSNQRPPYNLVKPFGPKDKRSKVILPYPEPLVHFALVSGTKSGPALRCYSPGNIDKELMDAARNFLRNGGLVLNAEENVASVSMILRWFSVDFGKNEMEVLKHAANYLEPAKAGELLELLASTQLSVSYQPYDWGLNV